MDDLPENCQSLNLSVWVWGLAVAFNLVRVEFAHGVTQHFACFVSFSLTDFIPILSTDLQRV